MKARQILLLFVVVIGPVVNLRNDRLKVLIKSAIFSLSFFENFCTKWISDGVLFVYEIDSWYPCSAKSLPSRNSSVPWLNWLFYSDTGSFVWVSSILVFGAYSLFVPQPFCKELNCFIKLDDSFSTQNDKVTRCLALIARKSYRILKIQSYLRCTFTSTMLLQ